VWGYFDFCRSLLAFAAIAFSLPAVRRGAETIFQISIVDVVLGLIALVVLLTSMGFSSNSHQEASPPARREAGPFGLLRNLAMVDPLTGLYNRRFAEQTLGRRVARSERKGTPADRTHVGLEQFQAESTIPMAIPPVTRYCRNLLPV